MITSEPFMASGSGSSLAYGALEQGFHPGLDLEAGTQLAAQAVPAAKEGDPGSGNGVDVLAVRNAAWREVA